MRERRKWGADRRRSLLLFSTGTRQVPVLFKSQPLPPYEEAQSSRPPRPPSQVSTLFTVPHSPHHPPGLYRKSSTRCPWLETSLPSHRILSPFRFRTTENSLQRPLLTAPTCLRAIAPSLPGLSTLSHTAV